MTQTQQIAGFYRAVTIKGAWYGPTLAELIAKTSPEEAVTPPIPGAHCILELLQHLLLWNERVRNTCDNTPMPRWEAEKEWAESPIPWNELVARWNQSRDGLEERIRNFRDEDLGKQVPGRNYPYETLLPGIVQHTIYHSGQIAMVLSMLRSWCDKDAPGAKSVSSKEKTLKRIRAIVSGSGDRTGRAKQFAETVRSLGNYRWTGVYDVGKEMVSIIAYSTGAHSGTSCGPGAPAYPTFPVSKGLTGSAIQEKATVVVGDVRSDPRYLTTFGNTLSEIIVPIIDPQNGEVIGTIDVESEHANAFSAADQKLLEECARAILPLWIGNQ